MDMVLGNSQFALLALVAGLVLVLAAVGSFALGQRRAIALLLAAQAAQRAEAVPISRSADIPVRDDIVAGDPVHALAGRGSPDRIDRPSEAPAEPETVRPVPASEPSLRPDDAGERVVHGLRVRADGSLVHLRQMSDAEVYRSFVAWVRDEADLPAESNSYEDLWERVSLVSWMRPTDLYRLYIRWCRDNAAVPDGHEAFVTNVRCVPGVHYGRHRLLSPAFRHIYDQIGKERAWVIRVASNDEMTPAVRRGRPRTADHAGAGRRAAGNAGPWPGHEHLPKTAAAAAVAAHGIPEVAHRMARAA